MQSTSSCPICGDFMRGIRNKNKTLHFLNKTSDYTERTCNGINHCLQIYINNNTNQVDLLKISLTHKYDQFIFIDFYNQKCEIVGYKNNKETISISVPKMIEPDFPDLKILKERVSTLITFS